VRRDSSALAGLSIGRVIDHCASVVSACETPPIIIGHSMGGAVVQVLLDRGLGSAGVALCSAPVRGVYRLSLSQLRTMGPILAKRSNRRGVVEVTPEVFHATAANAMTESEAAAGFAEYIVPGPGQPLFEAAEANMNRRSPLRVDLRRPDRAPLLLIAGGEDRMSPPRLVRENAKRQAKAGAVTAYQAFPGRSHYINQAGWEAVADRALDWALQPSSFGLN
jgi:pimeloyl-ACP methyl ester carboxylesterase